jgi:hypothetical protein
MVNAEKPLVLCYCDGRENAKRIAQRTLGGNPDTYIVTPLSAVDQQVIVTGSLLFGDE